MSNKKPNVLILFSDQHSKFETGCYGNKQIITPNIDALSKEGTTFDSAYTNSPICVPARACLAAGQYTHKMKTWDNASPYVGQAKSFGHRLRENNVKFVSSGKLHFRDASDDTGFDDERSTLHIRDGIGDVYGTLRTKEAVKPKLGESVYQSKSGESDYIKYDKKVTEEGLNFLENEAKNNDEPWVLYLGYTLPHFPFIAPEHTLKLYDGIEIDMPVNYTKDTRCEHETAQDSRRYMGLEDEISEDIIRRTRKVYYGMVSFLDEQIGMIIKKLKEIGEYDNTYIIYSTDHGEMLGNHGMWLKNCMYENSVAIPMILKGPDVKSGHRVNTNVSIVDIYPTVLDCIGIECDDYDKSLPGKSLVGVANQDYEDRVIFSEFHASGSLNGGFMVKHGDYKYIRYVGYKPQLFNTVKDPHDQYDLANLSEYSEMVKDLEAKLCEIVVPEEINAQAKKDQEERLDLHGGREYVLHEFVPVVYSPAPKV